MKMPSGEIAEGIFCLIKYYNYNYICTMPTVLRINGFRFFFFSNEGKEPVHIHVEKGDCYAKFWLEPVMNVTNYNFTSKELKQISLIIERNKEQIKREWNEYFSK